MYYYNNNDKDDPININSSNNGSNNHHHDHSYLGESINFDSNQLFGTSFEDLNNLNDLNNPFLNFGAEATAASSLPSQGVFDSSNFHPMGGDSSNHLDQDLLFNQHFQDYNIHNDNFVGSDNKNGNPSIFLQPQQDQQGDLDQQQAAILLSDPNFLRQQQLLLQEQKQQQQQQPVRSNLSAMFSNTTTNTSKEKLEPINLISSQQQKKDIINRRSISGVSSSSNKQAKPIPISSSLPSSAANSNSASTIDHQRRFNELQARFRINYAKKPSTKQQQQHQQQGDSTGTSVPITYNEQQQHQQHHLSSSYNEGSSSLSSNRRKLSLDPTAKPLLRMNSMGSKIKVAGGSAAAKSPTTSTMNGGGMAIPNSNNNTQQQQATTPTASSFPSRTMPIQIQRVHRANSFQPFDLEQRQKRLDDQLVKVDFNDITVSELKEMLRQRGKPATGKKAILLSRLQEEKDLILHARANGISISNRYAQAQPQQPAKSLTESSPIMNDIHAASLPDTSSMYLSSSPNNNTGSSSMVGSLNRSIADMHIGSPPMTSQQSRRFAPYATSPRQQSGLQLPNSPSSASSDAFYSSSVPTGSLDMMMMQQQQQQQQQMGGDGSATGGGTRVMRGFNFNKKNYAPFASSALATPDRDDDHNPFDDLVVKEEVEIASQVQQDDTKEAGHHDMEWTDPTLDFMIQQTGKFLVLGLGLYEWNN